MSEKKPLPSSRQELLAVASLYTEFDIAGLEWKDVVRRLFEESSIDAYCPVCERVSIFRLSTPSYKIEETANDLQHKKVIVVEAACSRDWHEATSIRCLGRLVAVFLHQGDSLFKIGLYPSRADADLSSLAPEINTELDPSLRKELGRAIGLRAHGIGIGSFVYLRRILESLIEEAHKIASASAGWDEDSFVRSRMAEKIAMLRDQLPSRLVRNAQLYAILSKGLHELTEQECLDHFDVVFEAIAMILKERHEDKAYEAIVRDVSAAAKALNSGTKTSS